MAGLRPADAFHFLLGSWQVRRRVSGMAAMAGDVTVRETAAGEAEYCERVTVKTDAGTLFSGSQGYVVRQLAEGFALYFAGGRAVFEEVRFLPVAGELRAKAVHLCGEDRYESEYVLGPGRGFMIRHRVRGPRKEYVSEAVFSVGDRAVGSD